MGQGSSLGPHLGEKKSKLVHVRGVGSSYRGSQEWLMFKLSGAFSIPLSIYIFISLLIGKASSYESLLLWLGNPINAGILVFTILTMATHAALGAIGLLDDYVHNLVINFFGGIFIKFFFTLVSIISIISVIVLMLRNI